VNHSEHFNSTDFACHCGCGFDSPDPVLIFFLECLREHFGNKPITVNSGCRCAYWNTHEGGKKNSRHLPNKKGNCEAADIVVQDIPASTVADTLEDWFKASCGIGRYYTFTHFDVRKRKARW